MSSQKVFTRRNVFLGIGAAGLLFYGYRKYVNKNKKLSEGQHVVIIGGGYGGITLVKHLKGRGHYTLIDQRDAVHHNMAALRAAVEPNFAVKSFIPYKLFCAESFVQDKVVGIDTQTQEVILKNSSKRIPYSQLVIATGSSGPFPGKCSFDMNSHDLIQLYEQYTDEVKRAKSIVIVGGGAVGVEMAGEIATDYPDQKSVTIVHNTGLLVSPTINQKARDIIKEKFEKKKINVILEDKVTNLNSIPVNKTVGNIKVELASGKSLEADLVIPCYGLSVNTDAYKDALGDSMNARGQLKVDDKLQVIGTKNIFAIGDCNDYDVTKLAVTAQEQGLVMFGNLVNIAKERSLQPYKPATPKLCVPIGRDGGFSQSGDHVLGDFFTKFIKATDVFVKIIWKKELGLNPPK